ncbi:MAG TPA: ion channel [Steroidobacteraceae bacterium]|nr:ion channel [Steroidobacteraceae bacterium]
MADREPRWRFLLLTLSLCAWMFLSPHLGDRWIVQLVLQLFLIHFVVVTLWANPRWGRMRQVLIGFWLLALLGSASTLLPMGRESQDLARIGHSVAMIPLLLLLAGGILRFVFARRQLDTDGIFATVAAYLLVAFAFAQAYTLLATVDPASFQTPVPLSERSPQQMHGDLVYYSLITLATVGYGDILPTTDVARTLAVIEATVGQFYVAVIVAVFVGMYSASRQQR